MGVLAGELDDDGAWDMFVTHVAKETNAIYRDAGAIYRDHSGESGLAAESLAFTGFGTAAIDLDLDGGLDLIVANGRVSGGFDAGVGSSRERFVEPNQLFHNLAGGRFTPLPWVSTWISRGIAIADLDGDGDDDWVVTNLEGSPEVWINEAPLQGHWLAVRARLPEANRDADGAVVILEIDGRRAMRRIDRGGGYLSRRDAVARFGLGSTTGAARLTIVWPDGAEEVFDVPGVDRVLEVTRGSGVRP